MKQHLRCVQRPSVVLLRHHDGGVVDEFAPPTEELHPGEHLTRIERRHAFRITTAHDSYESGDRP